MTALTPAYPTCHIPIPTIDADPCAHAGDLQCPDCSRTFTQAGPWKRYMRSYHQIPCQIEDIFVIFRDTTSGFRLVLTAPSILLTCIDYMTISIVEFVCNSTQPRTESYPSMTVRTCACTCAIVQCLSRSALFQTFIQELITRGGKLKLDQKKDELVTTLITKGVPTRMPGTER